MTGKRFVLVMSVCLLALLLAGCRRGEVSVQRDAAGGVDVTVALTEADVNAAVQDALAAGGNPLLRNPQVDLQPGVIVVTGEHDQRDGSGTVSGSIRVTATVENGAILVQATAVDIEGLSVNDEGITQLNTRLAEAFTRRADRDNRLITVQTLTIDDNNLTVTFNARRA